MKGIFASNISCTYNTGMDVLPYSRYLNAEGTSLLSMVLPNMYACLRHTPEGKSDLEVVLLNFG